MAENHDVEGDLATSWESPDAITWTVKLRTDAKFQNLPPVNGHSVESDDIRTTFLRAISPDNPFRSALDMLDPAQISTPEKNTVVFKLKYPFAPFQSSILASANYSWIFPREVSGGFDPAKTMIGSGPFLFDKYTPDVAVEYKGTPDWFGKPQPYVTAFKWSIISDTAQQRAQFTGGNLDLLGTSGAMAVNGLDLESLKRDNPKVYIVKGDPPAPSCSSTSAISRRRSRTSGCGVPFPWVSTVRRLPGRSITTTRRPSGGRRSRWASGHCTRTN